MTKWASKSKKRKREQSKRVKMCEHFLENHPMVGLLKTIWTASLIIKNKQIYCIYIINIKINPKKSQKSNTIWLPINNLQIKCNNFIILISEFSYFNADHKQHTEKQKSLPWKHLTLKHLFVSHCHLDRAQDDQSKQIRKLITVSTDVAKGVYMVRVNCLIDYTN